MRITHHRTVKPKGSSCGKGDGAGRYGLGERREERSVYCALAGMGSTVGSSFSQLLRHYHHQRSSEDISWMLERLIYVNLLRIVGRDHNYF